MELSSQEEEVMAYCEALDTNEKENVHTEETDVQMEATVPDEDKQARETKM